jgi:ATP-dependent Clp protease adaptor protein ClpS
VGLQSIVERAIAEARNRGHAELRPAHLLLATLDDPPIVTHLATNRRSIVRLVEEVEALLTTTPTTGYRDDSVALTSSASAFLATAKPSGVFGILRSEKPIDLFDAIVRHEPFASMLEAARFDTQPIRELYSAAAAVARERSHDRVLVEHALLSWAEMPRFSRALSLVGANPTEVHAILDLFATNGSPSARLANVEQLIQLAAVHANVSRRRDLDVERVVVDVLRTDTAKRALADADVVRADLLFAYVHGVADTDGDHEGSVEVVFHNDDYTTMEAVVAVLMEAFDYDEDRAAQLTRDIDKDGSAVAFAGDAADAKRRVRKARGVVRDRLMPLRMTVVQASPSA